MSALASREPVQKTALRALENEKAVFHFRTGDDDGMFA
jgi:hypothetical protein